LTEPTDFRGCYCHPRRPAIKECINCERPICAQCEEESGDPLLCKKCKDELEALDRTPFDRMLRQGNVVSSKRQSPSAVGEVTITPDGKIVAPEPTAPEPAEKEPEEAEPEVEPEPAAPRIKRRIPKEPDARRRARRPAPVAAVAKPAAAQAEPEAEEEEAPTEAPEEESYFERVARKKEEKRAGPRRDTTGPGFQMFHGLGYGIGVAIVVSALWLLFAFVTKQWTQVAILSLGLLVPWIMFKGTMARNRSGIKVWSEPPPPVWIAVPSLIIVMIVTPFLELLAYLIIYSPNPLKLPFTDFMDRFFGPLNWILGTLGLVAAVLVPFVLVRGQHWRKPSLKRSREAGEDEGEEEPQDGEENETL